MKIAFIHDWTVPIEEQFEYKDGIRKAVQLLTKLHDVIYITGGESIATFSHTSPKTHLITNDLLGTCIDSFKPDVLLCWGSLDRPWHRSLHERYKGLPKVLCFAGGPTEHVAKSYFNVIVCESQVYIDAFTKVGVTAMRGFGTNTELFRKLNLPKKFDAIYPASLCFHKNIELFSRAMSDRGLVVGNHNEPTIASKVLSLGSHLMHRVNSETLCDLYNMSNVTVVTAGPDGGAQRVVLESMSCGTPVIVMSDHDRCVEFVEESGFGKVVHPVECEIRDAVDELIHDKMDPQDGVNYVRANWSEYNYMESLEKACLEAINVRRS